jgi:hypothetical protein
MMATMSNSRRSRSRSPPPSSNRRSTSPPQRCRSPATTASSLSVRDEAVLERHNRHAWRGIGECECCGTRQRLNQDSIFAEDAKSTALVPKYQCLNCNMDTGGVDTASHPIGLHTERYVRARSKNKTKEAADGSLIVEALQSIAEAIQENASAVERLEWGIDGIQDIASTLFLRSD